ncbi:CsbD family protein [Streptomyces sp. SLBN-115]|uniref:CsbD family protein n=1 Tax=Streptomyces sp. SLBN-115 TaxID=2768453 RepID=UPI001F343D3E|nr:CsbD family protein [Streptomyces sp. SLBN-115]
MKDRTIEGLGQVTPEQRLRPQPQPQPQPGRILLVAGSPKQAVEKTKSAFGRNGSGI